MTCRRCQRRFESDSDGRCPHCGEANPKITSGILKTSTIVISAVATDAVYHSLSDVPHLLRTKLLKSTNGLNSATILIADRRGKEEIAKAIRRLPDKLQPKLLKAVFGETADTALSRFLQPYRRRVMAAILVALTLMNVFWIVTRKW